MSGGQSPIHESPFGYNLQELQNDGSGLGSLEPSGPPLLTNNETNLLDGFFNDPTDFAGNPASGKDFGADNDWFFANNFDWQGGLSTDLVSVPQPSDSHTTTALPDIDFLRHNPSQPHSDLIPASQEVYAAAASLVPNGMRSHAVPGYHYPVHTENQNSNHLSTGAYPHGLQFPPAQYQTTNNGTYNDFNNQFIPQRAESWREVPKPAPPLRFGSDNNFRPSSYTAEVGPERQVSDTIVSQLEFNGGQDYTPGKNDHSPATSRHKRRKVSEANKEDDEDQEVEDSADEDEEYNSKRRRRKKPPVKQELEQQSPSSQRLLKNGKQSAKPASTSKASASKGSSKRHSSSSAPVKPTRENLSESQKRENHIMSEQKRRNLIKTGYDSLERLVPELRQGGLSKSQILEETAAFMELIAKENEELKALLQASGRS